jgi:hypothetical protein
VPLRSLVVKAGVRVLVGFLRLLGLGSLGIGDVLSFNLGFLGLVDMGLLNSFRAPSAAFNQTGGGLLLTVLYVLLYVLLYRRGTHLSGHVGVLCHLV